MGGWHKLVIYKSPVLCYSEWLPVRPLCRFDGYKEGGCKQTKHCFTFVKLWSKGQSFRSPFRLSIILWALVSGTIKGSGRYCKCETNMFVIS